MNLLRGLIAGIALGMSGELAQAMPDGTIDRTDAFPNVVQLKGSGGSCSGVLIAPRTVVTAAHCVYFSKSDHAERTTVIAVRHGQETQARVVKGEIAYGFREFSDQYANGDLFDFGSLRSLDQCMCLMQQEGYRDFAVLTLGSDIPVVGSTKRLEDLLDDGTVAAYRNSSDFRGKIVANKKIDDVLRAQIQKTPAGLAAVIVGFGLTEVCRSNCSQYSDGQRRFRDIAAMVDVFCGGPAQQSENLHLTSFWCLGNTERRASEFSAPGDSGGAIYLKANDGSLILVGVLQASTTSVTSANTRINFAASFPDHWDLLPKKFDPGSPQPIPAAPSVVPAFARQGRRFRRNPEYAKRAGPGSFHRRGHSRAKHWSCCP